MVSAAAIPATVIAAVAVVAARILRSFILASSQGTYLSSIHSTPASCWESLSGGLQIPCEFAGNAAPQKISILTLFMFNLDISEILFGHPLSHRTEADTDGQI
jgi:hypothetical protein